MAEHTLSKRKVTSSILVRGFFHLFACRERERGVKEYDRTGIRARVNRTTTDYPNH